MSGTTTDFISTSAGHARPTAQPNHSTFLSNIREALRDPHPFARNTSTLKPHAVPWLSVYGARTLRTFGVLVPLAVVVFGWPFAGKALVNWSNGVSSSPKAEEVAREAAKSHKIARRAMLQQGPVKLEG